MCDRFVIFFPLSHTHTLNSLVLSLPLAFVVVAAADGLAHKASLCWPCCHGNQEILNSRQWSGVCPYLCICVCVYSWEKERLREIGAWRVQTDYNR